MSVQALVEDAVGIVTQQKRNEMCLVRAGRTDAGFHARGQVSAPNVALANISRSYVRAICSLPAEVRWPAEESGTSRGLWHLIGPGVGKEKALIGQ